MKSVPGPSDRPTNTAPRPKPPAGPSGAPIIVAVAVILVAVVSLSIPYYAIQPGPTEDVAKLVTISGAKTDAVRGQLLLTTVQLHQIRVGEAVRGWIDSNFDVYSRAFVIPPGSSEEQVEQHSTEQMSESQLFAAAAAMTYLGYHVQITRSIRIHDVQQKFPASKLLRPGDVIVAADGRAVKSFADLHTVIVHHKVGDHVGLRVIRGKQTIDISTPTVANGKQPAEPIIGVTLDDIPEVKLPLAVKYKVLGIGGPSAGLMFALGIVDLLDKADLTRGRIVAGTGEILPDGTVRAVGGVHQKIASARHAKAVLFLVPKDELTEACAAAKDLRVVGVTTLREGIAALTDARFVAAHSCPPR